LTISTRASGAKPSSSLDSRSMTPKYAAQRTSRRLRNGSFDSVAALTEAIHVWAAHWNDDPKPFVWHKTAKDIITKVRRGRAALAHHTKSATQH
jgi:hypothetical protein